MTKAEKRKYMQMWRALKIIARDYQTPAQIKRSAGKEYGLEYEESLEMSYENIQQVAKNGLKRVSPLKED